MTPNPNADAGGEKDPYSSSLAQTEREKSLFRSVACGCASVGLLHDKGLKEAVYGMVRIDLIMWDRDLAALRGELTSTQQALAEARREAQELRKELGWCAKTLSVFSANIPAEAAIDRTFVSGRLAEAERLGAKPGNEYAKIRPYEEPVTLATLRQQNEALRRDGEAALELLKELRPFTTGHRRAANYAETHAHEKFETEDTRKIDALLARATQQSEAKP